MRGSLLEVLGQDYIRTARAKGLSERRVVWVHGLRNALVPLIQLFALSLPVAAQRLAGHRGRLLLARARAGSPSQAILTRDYPVILAATALFGRRW